MKPTAYEKFLHNKQGEKWCTKCDQWKLFSDFYNNSGKSDGLQGWCKLCYNAANKKWRTNNRNRVNETNKKWRNNNKEKVAGYNSRWREENKEKVTEYSRDYYSKYRNNEDLRLRHKKYNKKYYETNKDLVNTRARRWAKNNPEKLKEAQRAYAKRNPEKVREKTRRRNIRKLNNGIEPYNDQDIFERDSWLCGECHLPVDPLLTFPNPMSKSIDHIIPVSLGGADTADNVQLAHLACNIKKSNKIKWTLTIESIDPKELQ